MVFSSSYTFPDQSHRLSSATGSSPLETHHFCLKTELWSHLPRKKLKGSASGRSRWITSKHINRTEQKHTPSTWANALPSSNKLTVTNQYHGWKPSPVLGSWQWPHLCCRVLWSSWCPHLIRSLFLLPPGVIFLPLTPTPLPRWETPVQETGKLQNQQRSSFTT